MKMFRKCLFWMHLATGLTAGLVVLIMSVTGALLAYEKQIIAWAEQAPEAAAPSAESDRMPVEALLEKVRSGRGSYPSSVSLKAGRAAPLTASYGRGETVYLNAYTGEILPVPATGVRAFFGVVTGWHRWLGEAGENRTRARAITGAANLGFLFLVTSGLYLWFPRKWRWPNFRAVLWFRGGLPGKARDFNWHNVAGFWCCVPLFFVVLSGVVISYPWASDMVYTLAGSEAPQGRGKGSAKGPAKGRAAAKGVAKGTIGGLRAAADVEPNQPEVFVSGIDRTLAIAQAEIPGWQSIRITLPRAAGAPVAFNVDTSIGGQPKSRYSFTVCRETGVVENREEFGDQDLGRRARSWMRFVHTGEYYGIVGQTVAGLASAGGALLVWTGIALAWRRFRAWQSRKCAGA